MSTLIEHYVPVVKFSGLNTEKAVSFTSTLAVTGAVALSSTLAVTGAVTLSSTLGVGAVTATSVSSTGLITAKSAATVPASAGAVAAGAPITVFSDGPSIYVTSDVPAFSAIKGSICINTAGSSSSTRLYVNNGTTNWVAITTAT